MSIMITCAFFFSSRRRHTRCSRDWSSDVCSSDLNARFQKFLRDHGHREVDFDAYQPTWIEVPWVVLDNLRLILQTPMDRTPSQKERELKVRMQQSEFELFSKLPPDLHYFFYEILRLARVYTSLDDLEHRSEERRVGKE